MNDKWNDELAKRAGGVLPITNHPMPTDDKIEAPEDLGPCAWCFIKPQLAIDIESGPGPVYSFQYVFSGIRSEFRPGEFILTFRDGEERWRVTVTGRNLRPVFDRCNEHRIRKLRKADRDFEEADKRPCITAIAVELVEEARE